MSNFEFCKIHKKRVTPRRVKWLEDTCAQLRDYLTRAPSTKINTIKILIVKLETLAEGLRLQMERN